MKKKYFFTAFIFVVVSAFCLLCGRIGLEQLYSYYISSDETFGVIFWDLRLPRLIAAALIGASLSISGVVFQAMFQNPLVSPNILGVASGAGFGAVLCILFSFGAFGISLGAFVGGVVAVSLAYLLGHFTNKNSKLMLVLSGIIISALFDALISLAKYTADTEEKLPSIVYCLMCSLSSANWGDLAILAPISLFGVAVLVAMGWKINILALSGEHAIFLGQGRVLGIIVVLIATLVTSASICVGGIVGWVGLLVPHIARLIYGANHAVLVPMSAVLVAMFLMLADTLARNISTAEIPLSIITAIIGAPSIAIIMIKKAKRWF